MKGASVAALLAQLVRRHTNRMSEILCREIVIIGRRHHGGDPSGHWRALREGLVTIHRRK